MREHSINQLNNFICGYYIDNSHIIDSIVDFIKTSDLEPGKAGGHIREDIKKSFDIVCSDELNTEYMKEFSKCMDLYLEKYKFANDYSPWNILSLPNLQYYPPSGAFFAWHTERSGAIEPVGSRHLVYMTYLNDVTDGGETEFYYQNVKIKPEKGLTIIWPADWTFTHRGIPSKTQEKYILTNWFNYTA